MKCLIITVAGGLFIWWNIMQIEANPPAIYNLLLALAAGVAVGLYLFNYIFDSLTGRR